MAADAHRLIAMSLGKINASRGQRGGVNLHKNLLVATVLTKARTIVFMQSYQHMMVNQRAMEAGDTVVIQPIEVKENGQDVSQQTRTEGAPNGGNHENSAHSQSQQQQQPCMFPRDSDSVENKENSPPTVPNQDIADKEISSEPNCARCTKRRLSEDDLYQLNNDDGSHIPSAKKCKLDFEVSSEPSSQKCEKMQTETTQITNLVNSFSSGFTGLLNTDCCTNTDQGYSSAEDDEDDDVFTSNTCPKSDNTSLISCSTQIKEAFETLARPCITLTV